MFACNELQDIFASAGQGVTLVQICEGARDPMTVAHVLAQLTGLAPLDFAVPLRQHRGTVILENLRRDIGEELARNLSQTGLNISALPSTQVPRLLGNVCHIDYSGDFLKVGLPGSPAPDLQIPWNSIELISVVSVPMHAMEKDLSLGHSSYQLHALEQGKSVERVLLADLFCKLDTGIIYVRLLARHLPYAHLGERIKSSSLENFHTVIEDLCERAPQHQKSERCVRFLAGQVPGPDQACHSIEEFDAENLRLLNLPW